MTTDSYCFCDLAPLYVLDMLSDAERQWVEQQIADCPDLAAELTEYQMAATALPYGVTVAPMADHLKATLFERLDLDFADPQPSVLPELPDPPLAPFLTVRSQDWQWEPHPTPGVSLAIIHTDPIRREIVGVLRAEAGVQYPLHRHAGVEELYMLSGDLIVENEVYGAGDYIRSLPGSVHCPNTINGCMFFFRTSMDDEYDLELVAIG